MDTPSRTETERSVAWPTVDDLRQLASGDEAAWVRFCRSTGPLIFAAAHRVGLSPEERDDLLQNTCVICFHSVDRLREPDRLNAWVYRIAYRQALHMMRKRPPGQRVEADGAESPLERLPDTAEPDDEVLERHERSRRLLETLATVGERCRRLLEALYLTADPPSYADVSQRLGIPIGSIGPTRARCLDRVRRRLRIQGDGVAAE